MWDSGVFTHIYPTFIPHTIPQSVYVATVQRRGTRATYYASRIGDICHFPIQSCGATIAATLTCKCPHVDPRQQLCASALSVWISSRFAVPAYD